MRVLCHHWDAESALQVLEDLDGHDLAEVGVAQGRAMRPLEALAEFQTGAARGEDVRVAFVCPGGAPIAPFAILAVGPGGWHGTGIAGLIARDHRHWRRPLAVLGAQIRRELPRYAARRGWHRIEARSWAPHPTGAALLHSLGFAFEATLPGMGPDGAHEFHQFAFIQPKG
jgi:hypothetical protein